MAWQKGRDHDGLMEAPVREPFTATANRGIIGLGPGPWEDGKRGEILSWPTEGYDSELTRMHWAESDIFAVSGYTKEEWLGLGDEMIRRWTEWRAFIATK